jgi:hypothetical protein
MSRTSDVVCAVIHLWVPSEFLDEVRNKRRLLYSFVLVSYKVFLVTEAIHCPKSKELRYASQESIKLFQNKRLFTCSSCL